MTKARDIISSTLGFRLNRLGPGETLDQDLAAACLGGLNEIADTLSGQGSLLFREILTPGVCNGVSGILGTTWAGLVAGEKILGASISYGAGQDLPLNMGTMAQYQAITAKATVSIPRTIYPDGASVVYLWPAAAGQTITLRTKQDFSSFATLDTDYEMPKGYQGAFSALLAELLAPAMLGAVTPPVAAAAREARARIAAQTANPAIVDTGRRAGGNVLTGWN